MLTRLEIKGFKNILQETVYFGPFTCIAGANGVGKSNLFDAIAFLRLLASQPLYDAALSIRDEKAKGGDVKSLFFHGPNHQVQEMSFSAEMIVSKTALDDLRQEAKATNTFLTYELTLRYRGDDSLGPLEITKESLTYITKGDSTNHLYFPHSANPWRSSWLEAGRRVAGSAFISTESHGDDTLIKVHQDKTGGRPQARKASILPRTVLSSVNASEAPTAVAAKHEMMNWRLLQFEPSALRSNDPIRAPRVVAVDGAHMPAALHGLLENGNGDNNASLGASGPSPDIRAKIAKRVSELVDDVNDVWVDEDTKRELLTLHATLNDGTKHPARSLSDGTLRFLALAIIEQTPQSGGLYCLEEPENGIHPERIPAVLRLLNDIATDPDEPVDQFDNPMRQVIINTHSPAVVMQVPDDSLIVAEKADDLVNGKPVSKLVFSALPDTWRTKRRSSDSNGKGLMKACPKSKLLSYLNPIEVLDPEQERNDKPKRKRVIDREDLRQLKLFNGDV